ncbi:hypothetical protein A8709_30170 [Paenibacillus pectinilyticus]|uniref:YhaN AAA domain-containing protein n=1 Tax=Paenibacillus pectinilyticus TaxID=512399 RepID=A0A1C0ZVI4_9BACL|nr:AAA family ATPase [Paenibacillus pectinilyticus]OCT12121.1 hypothetical protein A8709_30170 [Paenibacillus pectinilyticus]
MRIIAIQVDGFGSLRNRQLNTNSPLTVFYGANEAGKSTLMGFVRAVLFGFPTRASRSERYEPLGGGAHGGALTLLDEQGQRIRVERYDAPATGGKRASAGLVKVTLADGTIGGEELLNTLLGGLSADLYRSLFAFGLTELQELRTLQTDELSGYLYSAGLGVSGSAIMEAERKLTAQADGLYRPRGRNQEMNRLLKELEGLELSLRRSRDGAADYDRLQEERRAAEARAAALEGQQEALRAELHRLGLAGKARSGWLRLRQIGRELEGLPARPGFPEQATARLEALEAEMERLEAERGKQQLRLQSLRSDLAAMPIEPELLVNQVELNHWLEQSSTYEEHKRQIEQLQVEIAHQRAQIDRLLANLDVQWDETDVTSFAVTISLREQVRAYKEKFRQCAERELRMQSEQESLQRQVTRGKENVASLEAACRGMDQRGVGTMEGDPVSLLQKLASDYAHWQLLGTQLAHQQEREAEQNQFQLSLEEAAKAGKASTRKLRQRMMMVFLLLALALPVFFGWQGNRMASIGAFLLFACAAVYIWLTGRQSEGKRASRSVIPSITKDNRVEQELQQLERRIQEQIRQFQMQMQQLSYQEAAPTKERDGGSSGQLSIQTLQPYLDVWFREAERSKQQISEQQRKLEKFRDAREALDVLQQQVEQQYIAAEAVEADRLQVQSVWGEWLQELGLGTHLSTDALMETIQVIEQAQEGLRQLYKLASKLDVLVGNVTDFEQTISVLLGLAPTYSDHLFALKRWKEAEQRQVRQLAEQKQIEQLLNEAEEALLLLNQHLSRIQGRMEQLLEEASALDGEQLRKMEREHVARKKLTDEEVVLEASLESLLSRSMLASYMELMESHGEEDLALQAANLQLKLSDTVAQTNELREVVGKLTGQIEKLEQGSEAANQRLQVESIRSTLTEQVNQYAVASFAALLMKKARDVYEKERQPGVLLRASDYFERMTNGAFVAVKAPFGEQRLLAVRANGQTVDTQQLSRGTAEQLYLAMRFALVEEYAGKAILPLVLDDILVNFDEERMESCLRVLAELSTRHQVLLFTCHGHVRDAAARVVPEHLFMQL